MNDVSTEAYKEYEVLKSEILDEVMDVLVEDCHEHSCQGCFKKQFRNLQRELLF